MNGQQQPNQVGGYGMHPQMLDPQYSNMLNQQNQTLQQAAHQYTQNFYPQSYTHPQIPSQSIIQNTHQINQQLNTPQNVQQSHQISASQYYPFQLTQQTPQQNQTQPHIQPNLQQTPLQYYQQNAQPPAQQIQQMRQPSAAFQAQNQQQQPYYGQQQAQQLANYQFDEPTRNIQQPTQTQQYQQQTSSQQQHYIPAPQPKTQKISPAKEAENSAIHNEQVRKQRMEDEKRKHAQQDKRETERITEELKTQQQEAKCYANDVQKRLDQFKYPITLATCHVTTNLAKLLPVPQENIHTTTNFQCYDPSMIPQMLETDGDPELVEYMSNLLQSSFDEVRTVQTQYTDNETNLYEADNLPTLMKNVHIQNNYAFHILSEFDLDLDGFQHLQAIADEVVKGGVGDLLQLGEVHVDNMPSTSTANHNPVVKPNVIQASSAVPGVKNEELRKHLASLGKQPKGKGPLTAPRRKRDMVGELIDSLTPFYDVSTNRRGRRRARDDSKVTSGSDEENTDFPPAPIENVETTTSPEKFFQKTKKSKKKDDEIIRPPTPTDVLHQRDMEWANRQRERNDKLRRRQQRAEEEGYCHDQMAESESQQKVESAMESIFNQVGGINVLDNPNEKCSIKDCLIDGSTLVELRQEVSKLKVWRKLHKVNADRLSKLVQMLEKNIQNVIDEEGNLMQAELLSNDDIGNEPLREAIQDSIIRATEAGATSLLIMTAHKMSKHVLIEEAAERSAQLCKQVLRLIIYPAADSIVRNSKAKKSEDKRRKKHVTDGFTAWVQQIYVRVVEMIECFSELIRFQALNDIVVVQLSTMAVNPFFVDNIGEIHIVSIQLLSVIFRKYPNLRPGIIQDILISIHQIPSWKNPKNCYRLSNNESIHNFVVLVLQLIQSVVIMPSKKRAEEEDDEILCKSDDGKILTCFTEARKWAVVFLKGFLHKCTAKAEEDYRRRFELFLHDLLAAIYRPEWPAAELMLTVLGNLLVHSFRDKQLELSLRTSSLDYLGTIAAKLKKDRVAAERETGSHEKARLDLVVKGILYEDLNDPTKLLDDIDIDSLSSTDKMQKLQQALIDYLIATKSDNDVSAEYAISFYAGEWYKETVEDMNIAKERHKAKVAEGCDSRDLKKEDRRLKRITDRVEDMKEFLIKLADRKSLRKRSQQVANTGNYLIDADAVWTVKYLASKKEFSQSFDTYLKYIVFGVSSEQSVGLRTKAMRCLTQIIEADHQVLAMPEVYNAVNARMMDMNVAVREATIELLGKYLVSRPDLFDSYYSILNDRIMDTGIAVRKRVIRIFREYVDKIPDSEKVPEILSKIIRRVSDEEGVKKLALETLMNIWFTPMNDKDHKLTNKVVTLVDAVSYSLKETKGEHIDNLFTAILKKKDIERGVLVATQQVVDTLVDYVLKLDSKGDEQDSEMSMEEKADYERKRQSRLLSSLTTLSIISKVRPEVMVRHAEVFLPYLLLETKTATEIQVLNQVINLLERIIPLIEHPSEAFLISLDEKLCSIIRDKGMVLIQSAIACLGSVCKRWTKVTTKVANIFLHYIAFVKDVKTMMHDNINEAVPREKKPTLMRCLFSIGPMVRYFDFDFIIDGTVPSPSTSLAQQNKIGVYAEAVYQYLFFFSKSPAPDVNQKAVASLGHICAQYPEFFDRMDIKNMYQHLLASNDDVYLQRKTEVLKNLHLFLTVEEERMIKASEEYRRLKEAGELDDDLNATDTRGSINSAIIQIFWKHVLACYLHVNDNVRIAMSQVVYSTMMQGLVTPGDPLPTLIAMTTDPLPNIRLKNEALIKEIDSKYSGMLASKAVKGIRWSFEIQKRIARHLKKAYVMRGFRAVDSCSESVLDENGYPKQSSEGVAMLNALYSCLRTNRQQRRSFLSNVVRMFADNYSDPVSMEEMLFVADNLATFPYQVMDEPLFLIHAADNIISSSGHTVLTSVKEMLNQCYPGEFQDEEDEFNPQNLYRRLPDDKTAIYELMKGSQACFLLLYMKTYLKKLYRLSDAKVTAYSPSEAAKVYEKPIIRQAIPIFRPDLTLQELRPEVIAQRNTVEGHINLCEQISYFRTMFFSLDIHDEIEDDEEKDSGDAASSSNEPAAKKRKMNNDDDDDY